MVGLFFLQARLCLGHIRLSVFDRCHRPPKPRQFLCLRTERVVGRRGALLREKGLLLGLVRLVPRLSQFKLERAL